MKVEEMTDIYISSNEYEQANTLKILNQQSTSRLMNEKRKVHVRVSSTFNFMIGLAANAEESS